MKDVETFQIKTNVSSEHELCSGAPGYPGSPQESVLYGDVFEAAQEVIIVQAVQVLTHLALCRNALHIKELSRTGFEPCSRFMVLRFPGHLYASQARGVVADHGGVGEGRGAGAAGTEKDRW